MSKQGLSIEEQYALDYSKGFRLGQIESSRKILLNVIKFQSKKQGVKPSKALVQKVKRETDLSMLGKLIIIVACNEISVAELETYYDKCFQTKEEIDTNEYTAYGGVLWERET